MEQHYPLTKDLLPQLWVIAIQGLNSFIIHFHAGLTAALHFSPVPYDPEVSFFPWSQDNWVQVLHLLWKEIFENGIYFTWK